MGVQQDGLPVTDLLIVVSKELTKFWMSLCSSESVCNVNYQEKNKDFVYVAYL